MCTCTFTHTYCMHCMQLAPSCRVSRAVSSRNIYFGCIVLCFHSTDCCLSHFSDWAGLHFLRPGMWVCVHVSTILSMSVRHCMALVIILEDLNHLLLFCCSFYLLKPTNILFYEWFRTCSVFAWSTWPLHRCYMWPECTMNLMTSQKVLSE